jgi:hypothetical protein
MWVLRIRAWVINDHIMEKRELHQTNNMVIGKILPLKSQKEKHMSLHTKMKRLNISMENTNFDSHKQGQLILKAP